MKTDEDEARDCNGSEITQERTEYFRSRFIPETPTAKGFTQAREILDAMKMSPGERRAYEDLMDGLASYEAGYERDMQKSREEGRAEGCREKALQIAARLLDKGLAESEVCELTTLTPAEVASLDRGGFA